MTGGSIEIVGLEQFRERLRAAPKLLEAELRAAERKALQEVRDEARKRAPGNKLGNSISFEVSGDGLSGVIGSVAKTALSIEQGRQPGHMPPVNLIAAWMNRSGIVSDAAIEAGATVSLKTHRVTGRRKASVARAQRGMAWRIAQAIKESGTKAQPFLTPALPAAASRVNNLFSEAVQRAMAKVAK